MISCYRCRIAATADANEQIQKTIDMANTLDVDDFYISIVTPMPDTPLYDECIEKNLFLEGFNVNDTRFSAAKIKLPDTSPAELERLRRETWLQSFEQKRAKMHSGVEKRLLHFTDSKEYENIGFTSLKNQQDARSKRK